MNENLAHCLVYTSPDVSSFNTLVCLCI